MSSGKTAYDLSEDDVGFILSNPSMSSRSVAAAIGTTTRTVTCWRNRRGLCAQIRFSDKEREQIKAFYMSRSTLDPINLDELCRAISRPKTSVARTARRMGLTSTKRRSSPTKKLKMSEARAAWMRANTHPRGMTGKPQTAKCKQAVSQASKRMWNDPQSYVNSDAYRQRLSDRMTRRAGNRSLFRNTFSRAKSGTRDDIGFFVRSAWEANYCRYLKFLVAKNQIKSFEYEPDTFWFEKIKRGTRSYTPDFKIQNIDDSVEYHEVKGWMDQKSATRLARMARYYPNVKIVLIGAKEYRELSKMKQMITGWE